MANPYAVNVWAEVLEIFRGKEFGFEFDIGQDETGPADDLSDYVAAEFVLGQGDLPDVVWSIATGHVSLAGDIYSLHVPADETLTLVEGNFKWFASIGQALNEADEGVVRGGALVKDPV